MDDAVRHTFVVVIGCHWLPAEKHYAYTRDELIIAHNPDEAIYLSRMLCTSNEIPMFAYKLTHR